MRRKAPDRPVLPQIDVEPVLDPGQRIIDAHHHLYARPDIRYLLYEYLEEIDRGHDIRASVYVQARSGYRTHGPEALRPVGETEFALASGRLADRERQGRRRVCAAIVGHADLTLGDAVRPVLEAHVEAGEERFRGVRHVAAWDPDAGLLNPAYPTEEGLLARPDFHAGFTHLAALGLGFDAWIYFHQIPRLTALARSFPDVPIVLNHCGGVLGVRNYTGRHDEVFDLWMRALKPLASCPNVMVKLSGLGLPQTGLAEEAGPFPRSSTALAKVWRPWMETCVELFGPRRAMFASNAPADRTGHGFSIGWNAMKRIVSGASPDEKDDLFWRSAARFYRLPSEDWMLDARGRSVHRQVPASPAHPAALAARR